MSGGGDGQRGAQDWGALTALLNTSSDDTVLLSLDEIDHVIGGSLPPSARLHRPFWANSTQNTYSRHWLSAGYTTSTRGVPTGRIMFVRTPKPFDAPSASDRRSGPASPLATSPSPEMARIVSVEGRTKRSDSSLASEPPDLILLGCVKKKRSTASPARDLYCSPLWNKRRDHVEGIGVPWFILSAAHGLVDPDTVLEPYDVSMSDCSADERRAWASSVVEILADRVDLDGMAIEIHAGKSYQGHLVPMLVDRGATVEYPLEGLTQGEQLAWYASGSAPTHRATTASMFQTRERPAFANDDEIVASMVRALMASDRRLPANQVKALGPKPISSPGLYSWWTDLDGAAMLGDGLGVEVPPLIYVGQAGATRWPSGTPSGATLWSRIGQHLDGPITMSTFRLTLTALLETTLGISLGEQDLDYESHQRLNTFIEQYLSVALVPVVDPDTLDAVEAAVIEALDPPLNLNHVDRSVPSRQRLTDLRRSVVERLAP